MIQEHPDRLDITVIRDDAALPLALSREITLALTYYHYERIDLTFAVLPQEEEPPTGWQAGAIQTVGLPILMETLELAESRGTQIIGKVYGSLSSRLSMLAVLCSTEMEVSLDVELTLPAVDEHGDTPMSRAAIRSFSPDAGENQRRFRVLPLLEHGIATRLGSAEWSVARKQGILPHHGASE